MKATDLEIGDIVEVMPGVWAERIPVEVYEDVMGRSLEGKWVPFAAELQPGITHFWLVPSDAECDSKGPVAEWAGRN